MMTTPTGRGVQMRIKKPVEPGFLLLLFYLGREGAKKNCHRIASGRGVVLSAPVCNSQTERRVARRELCQRRNRSWLRLPEAMPLSSICQTACDGAAGRCRGETSWPRPLRQLRRGLSGSATALSRCDFHQLRNLSAARCCAGKALLSYVGIRQ